MVLKSEDCWLWTGPTSGKPGDRYGDISAGGREGGHLKAHRVSWELANGPIPPGMFVCHRCDVKLCVNPAHLFIGTNSENIRDAVSKGIMTRKTFSRPGGQNGRSKLSEEDVKLIRALYVVEPDRRYVRRGLLTKLSLQFGIHPDRVRDIAKMATWSHVA